jgi:hypothetical protein
MQFTVGKLDLPGNGLPVGRIYHDVCNTAVLHINVGRQRGKFAGEVTCSGPPGAIE